MERRWLLIISASAVLPVLLNACKPSRAQQAQTPLVRLAELEIDPDQLKQYEAALREEIETSIQSEPGVLTLYAVSLKNQPAHIRIFEMYADVQAYTAHVKTSHFLKYKSVTQKMVKSLKLLETDPMILGSRNTKR